MISYTPNNWYWAVADSETQAYSSATQSLVPIEEVDPERLTRIASMDELIEVLRAANVPPYHRISSYRIVRRLEAGGFADQALAVLDAPQNAVLKARFYTIDAAGGIPADDPDAVALVIAAGADPEVILAPESNNG